jgi:predicted deacylase
MKHLLLVVSTLFVLSCPVANADEWGAVELVRQTIRPGEKLKYSAIEERSFEGSYLNIPVFVARGLTAGPTLCVTAGIHGDEMNGVESARRAFLQADPATMAGMLVVLPTLNADGFRNGDRYLPDRRDLNRFFPGSERGSVASIMANAIFEQVIKRCDALVDLHTASFHRTNLPQIRVDESNAAALALARNFGAGIIIGGAGPEGSLRREAMNAGVLAIIYEAGEPLRFEEGPIVQGVTGIANVMQYLGMVQGTHELVPESRIFTKSSWVRAPKRQGGFFFPTVAPGDSVNKGDVLGEVVDPLTDERHTITATLSGEVIGMSVPQITLSGYGLVHIGIPGKAPE